MRMLPSAARLVLLAAGITLVAAPSGDMSIFQRYQALDARIVEARQALDGRRFQDALQLLEPCLQKVPDHFEAHFLLAQMAYEHRDYAGALAHMETSERTLAALDRQYRDQLADLKAQDAAEALAVQTNLDELTARGGDPGGCSANLYLYKQSDLQFLGAKKVQLYHQDTPFAVPAAYPPPRQLPLPPGPDRRGHCPVPAVHPGRPPAAGCLEQPPGPAPGDRRPGRSPE